MTPMQVLLTVEVKQYESGTLSILSFMKICYAVQKLSFGTDTRTDTKSIIPWDLKKVE
jgi:hypothetical protein